MKPTYSFYHIRNPNIDDSIFIEPCRAIVDEVLTTYGPYIQTPHITITLESNPTRCIPGMRVGGVAHSSYYMSTTIDGDAARGIDDDFHREYKCSVIHELHHVVRRDNPGYNMNKFSSPLVCEGLACLAEMEAYPSQILPYIQTTPDELQTIIAAARDQSDEYDHYERYFGAGDLPHWAGYKLGYYLLKEYSTQTGLSARDLISTSEKEIMESSIVQELLAQ